VSSPSAGAIVFTDIVGFTELTDKHGDDVAIELLELQDKVVQSALPNDSRIVKELGDGLLLWFGDPRAAVQTSLDLQQLFEAETSNGVPLWVRIGVHYGNPRRRGDDIIGRDVNLASRIAALAGPGEVLCTGVAAEAAGRIDGVDFAPLGPVFVRGIVESIPLLRITREGVRQRPLSVGGLP
jgi:class 3 adenylate cyclase